MGNSSKIHWHNFPLPCSMVLSPFLFFIVKNILLCSLISFWKFAFPRLQHCFYWFKNHFNNVDAFNTYFCSCSRLDYQYGMEGVYDWKGKTIFFKKETICLYIWDRFVCLTSLRFLEWFRKFLFPMIWLRMSFMCCSASLSLFSFFRWVLVLYLSKLHYGPSGWLTTISFFLKRKKLRSFPLLGSIRDFPR